MKYNHINFAPVEHTSTAALEAMPLEGMSFSVQYNVTNATPAAGAFEVELGDINVLTKANHGMALGLKVQVSSATTLPDGLLASTDYFVIPLNSGSFELAASLADALNGIAIEIGDAGTGVHTITPTALAGGAIKMQESVDGQNWYDISGVTANITASTIAKFDGTSRCGQIRPYLSLTAGQLQVTIKANTKE